MHTMNVLDRNYTYFGSNYRAVGNKLVGKDLGNIMFHKKVICGREIHLLEIWKVGNKCL